MWAQRPHLVFITINVSDCENPEIKVEKDSLYFKGTGGPDKKLFETNLKLFGEIKEDTVKYAVRPRCIEFALEKVEEGPYWSRLLADKTKQHWLKVDFSKWKDEDDSDAEGGEGGGDLEDMMRNMGGLGGGMGGMPGMGGMGGMGMPGMGGMPGMPGGMGMGGMPGMGMGGMPGMGGMGGMDMASMMASMGAGGDKPDLGDLDGEGDSDDEPLPDLE